MSLVDPKPSSITEKPGVPVGTPQPLHYLRTDARHYKSTANRYLQNFQTDLKRSNVNTAELDFVVELTDKAGKRSYVPLKAFVDSIDFTYAAYATSFLNRLDPINNKRSVGELVTEAIKQSTGSRSGKVESKQARPRVTIPVKEAGSPLAPTNTESASKSAAAPAQQQPVQYRPNLNGASGTDKPAATVAETKYYVTDKGIKLMLDHILGSKA